MKYKIFERDNVVNQRKKMVDFFSFIGLLDVKTFMLRFEPYLAVSFYDKLITNHEDMKRRQADGNAIKL